MGRTRGISGTSDRVEDAVRGLPEATEREGQFEVNRENCGAQDGTVRVNCGSGGQNRRMLRKVISTMSLAAEEKRHGPLCLPQKRVDARE